MRHLAILFLLLGAGFPALSQTSAMHVDAPPGDDTVALQRTLAPFASLLERLPPPLRERLELHARAWLALSPEEQIRLRENLSAWDDLEPLEKLALRERFDAWEHMDATTRRGVLDAASHYARLPEDIQAAWRARFEALSPEARLQYLFDPPTRKAMALASQLFPFVPAEEHDATLAMLRELAPAQVEALRRTLARLPPNRRNAYRVELLAMDPATRARELGGSH